MAHRWGPLAAMAAAACGVLLQATSVVGQPASPSNVGVTPGDMTVNVTWAPSVTSNVNYEITLRPAVAASAGFRDDFTTSTTPFPSSTNFNTAIIGLCRSPGYLTTYACFNTLPVVQYSAATVPVAASGSQTALSGLAEFVMPQGSALRVVAGTLGTHTLADYGLNGVPIVPFKNGFGDKVSALETFVDGSENYVGTLSYTAAGGFICYDIKPPPLGGTPTIRWLWAYVGIFATTSSWQPRLRYIRTAAAGSGAVTALLDYATVNAQVMGIRMFFRVERLGNGWRLLVRRPTDANWLLTRSSSICVPVCDDSIFYDKDLGYTDWTLPTIRYGLVGESTITAVTVRVKFDYVATFDEAAAIATDNPPSTGSCALPRDVVFTVPGSRACPATGGACSALAPNRTLVGGVPLTASVRAVDTSVPSTSPLYGSAPVAAAAAVTPVSALPSIAGPPPAAFFDSASLPLIKQLNAWADTLDSNMRIVSVDGLNSACAAAPCARPATTINRLPGVSFAPVTFSTTSLGMLSTNGTAFNRLDLFSAGNLTIFAVYEPALQRLGSVVVSKGGGNFERGAASTAPGWALAASERTLGVYSAGMRVSNGTLNSAGQGVSWTGTGTDTMPTLGGAVLTTSVIAQLAGNTHSVSFSLGYNNSGLLRDGVSSGFAADSATYAGNTFDRSRFLSPFGNFYIGGATGTASQNAEAFAGNIFGVLIYDRILPDADVRAVQRFLTDRYYLTCPAIPGVSSSRGVAYAGIAATDGCSGVLGGGCTQSCTGGTSLNFGGLQQTCSRGRWTTKMAVCGSRCPTLAVPRNSATCSKRYHFAPFTLASELDRFDTEPKMPALRANEVWSVSGGVLTSRLPEVSTVPCAYQPEVSHLVLNSPAWAANMDTAVQYRLSTTITLRTGGTQKAGVIYRFTDANNYWRFAISAAGLPELTRFVGGVRTSFDSACVNRTVALVNTAYNVRVNWQGTVTEIWLDGGRQCFHSESPGTNVIGSVGVWLDSGSATFDNLRFSSSCDSQGAACTNLQEGSSCEFTCVPGYALRNGTAASTCTSSASVDQLVQCIPLPPVPSFTTYAFTLPERAEAEYSLGSVQANAAGNTPVTNLPAITYTLLPDDNFQGAITDLFKIVQCTGEVRLATPNVLDFFLGRRSFALKVMAWAGDERLAASSALINVNVAVTNVNDPPRWTLGAATRFSATIAENVPVGTFVGNALPFTDPDSDPGVCSIVGGNTDGLFSINPSTCRVSVAVADVDFEKLPQPLPGQPKYQILVRVSDAVVTTLFDTAVLDVYVTDVNEPVVLNQQALTVSENDAKAGHLFTTPIVAVDPDAPEVLTWSVVNISRFDTTRGLRAAAGLVSVEPLQATLNFTLDPQAALPYNEDNFPAFTAESYEVREYIDVFLRVEDKGGLFAINNVRIYVVVAALNASAPMIVSWSSPTPIYTSGGTLFYLEGRNFDRIIAEQDSPNVTVLWNGVGRSPRNNTIGPLRGPAGFAPCTVQSDTRIACLTTAGFSGQYLVRAFYRSPARSIPVTSPIFVSYAEPTIRDVKLWPSGSSVLSGLPGDGTASIALFGLNFGVQGIGTAQVRVWYGPVTGREYAAAVNWTTGATSILNRATLQEDRVVFRMALGTAKNMSITLCVANLCTSTAGNSSQLLSYANPVITNAQIVIAATSTSTSASYTINSMATLGAEPPFSFGYFIEFIGRNFGPRLSTAIPGTGIDTPVVWFGSTIFEPRLNRNITMRYEMKDCFKIAGRNADQFFRCSQPPGVGFNHTLYIVIDGVDVDTGIKLTYFQPRITGISGAGSRNADTAGGQQIVLAVNQAGPLRLSADLESVVSATYGPTGSEYIAVGCLVTVAGSTIECKTAEGTGTGHSWRIFMGNRASTLFTAVRTGYAAPTIIQFARTSVDASTGLTTRDFVTGGGEQVVVVGRNFGPAIVPGRFSALYRTQLTTTRAQSGAQLGDSRGFINAILPGGSCTMLTPHTELLCTMAPGAGTDARWFVTVDSQNSTLVSISYGVPSVTAIETTGGAAVTAASTDGGDVIVIRGRNFGPSINCNAQTSRCAGLVQFVKFGVSGTEQSVRWYHVVSHTEIRAELPPGFGQTVLVTVSVADQVSPPSTGSFAYALPVITSVDPPSAATDSRAIVTVRGTNFALLDADADVSITFGNVGDGTQVELPVLSRFPSPGNTVGYTGTQSLTFALPNSLGANRVVKVRVYSRARPSDSSIYSNAASFSYRTPALSSVVVAAPPAEASRPPALTNWLAANLPGAAAGTDALYQLTLYGTSFGPSPSGTSDSIARAVEYNANGIGVTPAQWVASTAKWYSWSDTQIVAYTSQAAGEVRIVYTAYDDGASAPIPSASAPQVYTDVSPEVGNVVGPAAGFDTRGGEYVTFDAKFLFSTQTSLAVTVGGRPCPLVDVNNNIVDPSNARATLVTSTSPAYYSPAGAITSQTVWTLRCRLPAGQGKGQPLVITRDSANSTLTGIFVDYAPPSVTLVEVHDGAAFVAAPFDTASRSFTLNLPTDGARVRVTGVNFGICPRVLVTNGAKVLLGPYSAASEGAPDLCGPDVAGGQTASHTSLDFFLPPGTGTGDDFYPGVGWTASLQVVNQAHTDAPAAPRLRVRFMPPSLTSVTSTGRTAGGDLITIVGKNFGGLGPQNTTEIVAAWIGSAASGLGMLPCTNLTRASSTLLTCVLAEGSGASLNLDVQIADQRVTFPAVFSYRKPEVGTVTVRPAENVTVVHDRSAGSVTRSVNGGNVTVLQASGATFVTGPSTGGYLVELHGDNFGVFDYARHCLFVAWRGRDPANAFACDGAYSWLGEGDVPSYAVLEWTHTHIVFYMPPGTGAKDIIPHVRGQMPVAAPVWRYDIPELTAELVPSRGDTEGGYEVVIKGASFGVPAAPKRQGLATYFASPIALPVNLDGYLAALQPPMAVLRVNFFKTCVSDDVDVSGARPSPVVNCRGGIIERFHDSITVAAPAGIGANRTVTVSVYDVEPDPLSPSTLVPVVQTSGFRIFDYNPPEVTVTSPRPVFLTASTTLQSIALTGKNFGTPPPPTAPATEQWTPTELSLAVDVGGIACVTVERVTRRGEQVLDCDVAAYPVGYYNLTYTLAGQTGRTPEDSFAGVFMACKRGFYGRLGETCLPCMEGANCPGFVAFKLSDPVLATPEAKRITPPANTYLGNLTRLDPGLHLYPVPLEGWYNLNKTDTYSAKFDNPDMTESCPDSFKVPGRDVCVVPCEPPEACLGNNFCATGYTSKPPQWRCASCDAGFYKRGTECVKCPDSPYALVIGFTLLVVFGAGLAYWLNKRNVNLAFVSIGIDFFQVISILLLSKVGWPESVKQLLHILSAFNLNLDIVAPECLVPDVSYRTRWYFIMLLPISLSALFGVIHTVSGLYNKVIKGQSFKKAFADPASFISSVLLLMYILYIYLTRQVLDVFNCAPSEPPAYDKKGNLIRYMVAVFEECGVPGGTQLTLLPAATAALIIYVAGYPAFIAWLLHKNRETVMEDQLLRAKGVGDDRLTNPHCLPFRKMWSRVYYQFKPDTFYWGFIILNRKLWLAVTFVIFNRNSAFQLAACLLVMFLSYALHMRFLPYLSPGDWEQVIADHDKAVFTSPIHARLHANISAIESRGRKRVRRNLLTGDGKVDTRALLGVLRGWLFNYNTVEAVMLFGAVVVNLMGVMYAAQKAAGSYYAEARDAVTTVVLIVIIACILYFLMVVVVEIVTLSNISSSSSAAAASKQGGDARSKSGKAIKAGGAGSEDGGAAPKGGKSPKLAGAAAAGGAPAEEFNTGNLETSLNPLFMTGQANQSSANAADALDSIMNYRQPPPKDLWKVFQAQFLELQAQADTLAGQVAGVQTRLQSSSPTSTPNPIGASATSAARRKATGSTGTARSTGTPTSAGRSDRDGDGGRDGGESDDDASAGDGGGAGAGAGGGKTSLGRKKSASAVVAT